MDKYEQFKEDVKMAAEKFRALDKKETIRLIGHLDADGISSCAIMIRLMNLDNRKYSISVMQQLSKEVLQELAKEPYKYFVFADLGSGQLRNIKDILKGRKIIILDHHEIDGEADDDIIHVNPHLAGIDGSKEISGSGVVYLFASAVDKALEGMSHIAIIGAVGDIQEKDGFLRLNNEILENAVKTGRIRVEKGLRLFGFQTRPLHKVLEYSTDPYIPGVSGSESGAIQFLQQLGINPKNGKDWNKLVHLSEEDMQKLVAGIVMKRASEDNPEDVLGNIYVLEDEKLESPMRDAKEFSTLLNACGRMGKASLGIGSCLGDNKIKQRAMQNLLAYKKEIINALEWYNKNKESKYIIEGEGYTIINAQDIIMSSIIGTLASIISKSNGIKVGTFVLSLAQILNGYTKVSLRIAGNKDVDLRLIVKEITEKIEGSEAGGHIHAAGALIPTDKEEEFIEIAQEVLKKKAMEEDIL